MDVKLIANGVDFSNKISTYDAYMEVTQKVLTMLDDSERPYPAVFRPVVRFSLLPMTDTEATAVYNTLKGIVFPATFEISGQEMTADVRVVGNLGDRFLLTSPDGKRRYKGAEITLRGLRNVRGGAV